MSGRLKLKSIYSTQELFRDFCLARVVEFYPLLTDMTNFDDIQLQLDRYVFKPLYRQFKNTTCRYLPTEEGIEAFNNQFTNQLEEVVFDFLIYTSTNIHYFNESITKVGENLEQGVSTFNNPINQDIKNTKANTTIADGATSQSVNLMIYNGYTSWLKAFSNYYTPQRKAELIDNFRWLFISFYVGCDEAVTLIRLTQALEMANGNMIITPEENEILRSITIEKPDTLIPENIKNGVNIGGVVGNLEIPEVPVEEQTTVELDMKDGNQVITPDEGKVFGSVTVNKPDTMIPENIKNGVNIGGVVGTLQGESGGVDLDEEHYFYIGSNSVLNALSGIYYSTDYGKTWNNLRFGEDPYGNFNYSATIEVYKGINMYINSNPDTAKYGIVLLKSSGNVTNLTSPNTGGSVLAIKDIQYGYLLISRESFQSFIITMGSGGGSD